MQNLSLKTVSQSFRRRGNVLAFLLMGIIALLAIAVVFFSRARRPHEAARPVGMEQTVTTGTENLDADVTTSTGESAPASATPHVLPPPPPTLATPAPQDLPPEG